MRNLSGEKGTILVVDDEASIRRILQTRLEMIGYSVVTASDGEEALSAFRLLTEKIGDWRLQIADSFWYKPSTKVGGINLKSSISNPQAASLVGVVNLKSTIGNLQLFDP